MTLVCYGRSGVVRQIGAERQVAVRTDADLGVVHSEEVEGEADGHDVAVVVRAGGRGGEDTRGGDILEGAPALALPVEQSRYGGEPRTAGDQETESKEKEQPCLFLTRKIDKDFPLCNLTQRKGLEALAQLMTTNSGYLIQKMAGIPILPRLFEAQEKVVSGINE